MNIRAILVSGVVLLHALPAFAAPRDARLDALERQLRDVQRQLSELKANPASDPSPALAELRRAVDAQHADLRNTLRQQPRTRLDNGRMSVTSADGEFSLSLRSLVQFDMGYFAQGRNPAGVDLNSGTNFRRAQIGVTGTATRDWSYNIALDFGGNGIEGRGYLYRAYIQYDGFKPFGVRIGAFAPPAGLDDSTSGGDLQFLERSSAGNIARGIAGSRSRSGVSVFAQDSNYLASLALTGGRTTDSASFDEQQGFVARAAWLALDSGDTQWLLDSHASHVFRLADVAPGPNPPNTFSLGGGPELAVDATRTIDTGALDARQVTEFGFETAINRGRFYGQGGWFRYDITRRSALPSPVFSGWYAQASWSLSGESKRYDPTVASFRGLRPDNPLGKGLGAWEAKARFSHMNLDFDPLAATGAVKGGVQDVWTLGLNWYPNQTIRFLLDYDRIRVHHINAPATDISADAVGLRTQIAL
jgi:phosphate-selective porin OprO/OprP